MLRKLHKNVFRFRQHSQAESLLERCLNFSEDYDALKWEFAPNKKSPHVKLFDETTGKDDIKFAILRENICCLVEMTRETLKEHTGASHSALIEDLTRQLDWIIRKAKKLRIQLEGGKGHTYRDGRPDFQILCPTKPDQYPAPSRTRSSHSKTGPNPQSATTTLTLRETRVEVLAKPPSQTQNTRTRHKNNLREDVQALNRELDSERWQKGELREDLEMMYAECAKRNGGKQSQKPRPAYLEQALEASIDKASPWVIKSRLGEATSNEEERSQNLTSLEESEGIAFRKMVRRRGRMRVEEEF